MTKVRFGKYPLYNESAMPLASAAIDGYKIGLTWQHKYRPGGPHVLAASLGDREKAAFHGGDKKDWVDYCDHTKKVRDVWLDGFDEGRKAADLTAVELAFD